MRAPGFRMPNANYRNGAVLENAAMHALSENGYFAVRSAGSKGAVDVVALKQGEILLVQCKLDGVISPDDRLRLWLAAGQVRGIPLIARWHKPSPRARREVRFLRMASSEQTPKAFEPWTPDHGMAS